MCANDCPTVARRCLTRRKNQRLRERLVCRAAVLCLASGEGDVSVLDHVLDLSSHCAALAISTPCHSHFRAGLLVRPNKISQYTTNTGQNTGRLKISNQLQKKPMAIALVVEYQNLNSGSLRTNGRNSWSSFVGSPLALPSSIPSSCSSAGSNFGERKARKRFRR